MPRDRKVKVRKSWGIVDPRTRREEPKNRYSRSRDKKRIERNPENENE